MKANVRYGLIVGTIGFFINFMVSIAFGICGPGVSLVGGIIAGILTARAQFDDPDVVMQSAIAGGISGGISVISQILAAILVVLLAIQTGMQPLIGQLPSPGDPAAFQLMTLSVSGSVGFCFGLIGVAVSAGAAALAAYAVTRDPNRTLAPDKPPGAESAG